MLKKIVLIEFRDVGPVMSYSLEVIRIYSFNLTSININLSRQGLYTNVLDKDRIVKAQLSSDYTIFAMT